MIKTSEYDVVVVGAGASGVPAAVAAARSGAKVALFERTGRIGGTHRSGFGVHVCGLFSPDGELLNAGLSKELYDSVIRRNQEAVEKRGKVYLLRCLYNELESIYTQWVEGEAGIDLINVDEASSLVVENQVRSKATETGLETSSTKIESIRLNAQEELVAPAFVDCSGCGALIKDTSIELVEPEEPALSGVMVRLENVDVNEMLRLRVPHRLFKAVQQGTLDSVARFSGIEPDGAQSVILKLSVSQSLPLSAIEKTVVEMIHHLQQELNEFSGAVVAEQSGVLHREGRRLKGQTILSEAQVKCGTRFNDAVARCSWPMEFWHPENGPSYGYVENDFYEIPLGSLKSSAVDNLWAAGRLISADAAALSSARVVGACIATGEAAGRLASEVAV